MDVFDAVKVWDLPRNEQILTVTRDEVTFDWDLAWSADGRSLAITSKKSEVLVFDLAARKFMAKLSDGGDADGLGVALDPEGQLVAASATAGGVIDKGIDLWSLDARSAAASSKPARLPACRTDALVWGHVLVAKCLDQPVTEVWNPKSRSLVRRITAKGPQGWSANAALLFSCGVEKRALSPKAAATPASVCSVEEMASGKRRRSIVFPRVIRGEASLDSEGNTLASTEGGSLRVWDLSTPVPRESYGPSGRHPVFSPDGKKIAVAAPNNAVVIWDVAERKVTQALGGEP